MLCIRPLLSRPQVSWGVMPCAQLLQRRLDLERDYWCPEPR